MALLDIFSKRQRRLRGDVPDVYVYDKLPEPFRVQVVHILRDALGPMVFGGPGDGAWEAFKAIVEALRREYGVFRLYRKAFHEPQLDEELFNFFLGVDDVDCALDVIELSARVADQHRRVDRNDYQRTSQRVDTALDELNARFREHGIGYYYEAGELIRVDSDLLHVEAVRPAVTLLHTHGYDGPLAEFLAAHEHYRHGRHEAALTEALKAFESTMKSVCSQKGWVVETGATAKRLIEVCLRNGLVDSFWQTQFGALRATLESGIATARNRVGAHGQGIATREVPQELVAYVLHMTASTIVFLIEAAARQT